MTGCCLPTVVVRLPARLRCLCAILTIAFWVSQSGCAGRVVPPVPSPPSEETRSTFGIVGVTWAAEDLAALIDPPAAGTWDGMSNGALVGLAVDGAYIVGCMLGVAYGTALMVGTAWTAVGFIAGLVVALIFAGLAVLGVALLPLASLAGAIYGAAAAPSAEEVETALATLQRATAESRLPRRLGERIVELGRARTDAKLKILEPGAPRASCDSILEVGRPGLLLATPMGVDPKIRLLLSVPVRMIRASDGLVLHTLTLIRPATAEIEFLKWAANDAAALKKELEGAPFYFADRIVEEFFLLFLVPRNRLWKAAP